MRTDNELAVMAVQLDLVDLPNIDRTRKFLWVRPDDEIGEDLRNRVD